jgi:hypothetical protein
MSGNYTLCQSVKGAVDNSVIANGTVLLGAGGDTPNRQGPGSYIWAKNRLFKIISAAVRINTVAASATQSFQVQKSDSTGDFTTPTVLATVTITSGNAAKSLLETAVSAALTDVDNSDGSLYAVQLVHVATSTDATLNYDYEVVYTYNHC